MRGQGGSHRPVWAAVAAGVMLRVIAFAAHPSLSMDEARLAVNLAGRRLGSLAAPLWLDQSAPLFFLWAERLVLQWLGPTDIALRIIPLLAGIAVVVLMVPLALRWMCRRAALLSVTLVAVAPTMVTYSNEAKQYMVETLVALVLVRLALDWLEAPTARASLALGLGGAVAVWLSGSAPLVLAGVAAAFACRPRRARPSGWAALTLAVVWTVSTLTVYALVYRRALGNQYLGRYWANAYLSPGSGMLPQGWTTLKELVWGFMVGHSGVARRAPADAYVSLAAVVGVGCVIGGAVSLWRRGEQHVAALLAGPLLAVVVASALRLYPLGQRLLLFSVPAIILLGAAGLLAVLERASGAWQRRAWWAVGGLVVLPLAVVTTAEAARQGSQYRMRAAVQLLTASRPMTEPVYVFARALPAWIFYSTDWHAPDRRRLAALIDMGSSGGAAFENAPSRHAPVGPQEGSELSYRGELGTELIGIPTGMEYVAGTGLVQRRADPGWAEREAERVRMAASPGAWVILTEFLGPEYDLIEVLRRFGTVTFALDQPGHIVARFVPRPPVASER